MASATFECPALPAAATLLLLALLRAVGASCFLLHFAEGTAEAVVLAIDGASLRAEELFLLRCCCCCCLLVQLLRDLLSERLREDCELCLRCCCCCVRDRDLDRDRDRARRCVERERVCDRSCARECACSGVRERERECLLEGGS
eukprot:15050-Heterococcus_DN1.PRE.1